MITGFSCKWTHLILGIFILVSAALFQVASVAYASPVNILSVFLCVFSFISSTVGGIILTKAFETDKNFIKKLEPLLFPIIRKNHINTAQINKIVQEYKNDPQSPIGIRIGDMIPNLSSVTTDLISLSGQNLANAISSFNSNLVQLKEILLRVNDEQNGVITDESKKEIAVVLDRMNDISDSLSPSMEKVNALVECPFCNTKNNILIGVVPPASAMPICKNCDNRFHANRQHDGSILTKKPGHSK